MLFHMKLSEWKLDRDINFALTISTVIDNLIIIITQLLPLKSKSITQQIYVCYPLPTAEDSSKFWRPRTPSFKGQELVAAPHPFFFYFANFFVSFLYFVHFFPLKMKAIVVGTPVGMN